MRAEVRSAGLQDRLRRRSARRCRVSGSCRGLERLRGEKRDEFAFMAPGHDTGRGAGHARIALAGLSAGPAPGHAGVVRAGIPALRRCGAVPGRPPRARVELLVLFHPDAAHRVLAVARNYRKENVFYSELRSAFGDGLLTSQDAQWQRQKRFLQPLFVSRRVDDYAAAMNEQVHEIIRRWRSRPPGIIDLHEEMTRLTLATVCRILFGEDLGQVLPVVQRTFGPLGDAVACVRSPGPRAAELAHPGEPTAPARTPGAARRLRRDRRPPPSQRRTARRPAGVAARRAGRAKLADRRRDPGPGAHLLAGRIRDHLDRADLRPAPARPGGPPRATPDPGRGGDDRQRAGPSPPRTPRRSSTQPWR